MRFNRSRKTELLEGDLTPMIDMTFQLIAFFMIIMNFSKVDRAEEIELPRSQMAIPPDSIPDYQIILNLDVDGTVKSGGNAYPSVSALKSFLKRQISAAERDRVAPEDISTIIRAHENTPTGKVQELIQLCQDNKLANFILRVKEKV